MHYAADYIQAVSTKARHGWGEKRGGIVKMTVLPKYISCAWIKENETCDSCPWPSDCHYERRK